MDLETPDSYATQFFGFTPDSFVENIHVPSIEIINEHLKVSLHSEGSGRFCCHRKKLAYLFKNCFMLDLSDLFIITANILTLF